MDPNLDPNLVSLLGHHFQLLQKVVETGMLWWVSSVVFCGAILAAFWLNRKHTIKLPGFHWICSLVLGYFLTIIFYGGWVIYTVARMEKQILDTLTASGVPTELYLIEFTGIKVGYFTGITSFIFVAALWGFVWVGLARERKRGKRKRKKKD